LDDAAKWACDAQLGRVAEDLLSPGGFGIDLTNAPLAAFAVEDDASADERQRLRQQLELLFPDLITMLDNEFDIRRQTHVIEGDEKGPGWRQYVKAEKGSRVYLGGSQVNDRSTNIGDNANISQSVIGYRNALKKSLNIAGKSAASDEIKRALMDLKDLLSELDSQLDDSAREEVARQFKVFSAEAVAATPNHPILEAVGNAIGKAVSGVATYGPRIIQVIAGVIALIHT
jgi:hypothetical protein